MPAPTPWTTAALVAGAATLLGACGGGDDAPVVARVSVDALEMAFEPEDLFVPAGRVEITLVNSGTVPHTFVIQQRGFKLKAFEPGRVGESGVVDLPDGEAFFVYCDIEGHRDLGMEGSIFVGTAEKPATTEAGAPASSEAA